MAGFDVSGSGGGASAGDVAPTVQALGNLGATETIDMAGETWVWATGTLDANCAVTLSNLASGDRVTLYFEQDATGGRTLSVNGTALNIATAAGSPVKVECEYDGTDLQVDVAGGGGGEVTVARKTADQTLTQSNTTLQNVTGLSLAVAANETWLIELTLFLSAASVTPDFKFGFTVPASATMLWGVQGTSTVGTWLAQPTGNDSIALIAESGTQSFGASANTQGVRVFGKINVAGTAGTLQFQASQAASHASDNKVLEDSCLIARRIATS